MAAAFVAVADVDCEGFGERRFEGYGAALAGGVHFWFCGVRWEVRSKRGGGMGWKGGRGWIE